MYFWTDILYCFLEGGSSSRSGLWRALIWLSHCCWTFWPTRYLPLLTTWPSSFYIGCIGMECRFCYVLLEILSSWTIYDLGWFFTRILGSFFGLAVRSPSGLRLLGFFTVLEWKLIGLFKAADFRAMGEPTKFCMLPSLELFGLMFEFMIWIVRSTDPNFALIFTVLASMYLWFLVTCPAWIVSAIYGNRLILLIWSV